MTSLFRYATISGVIGINVMLILTLVSRWLACGMPLCALPSSKQHSVSHPNLHLNEYEEFSITIFSDLHYGEEEHGWGIDQDINSTRVMNKVLETENPDLVILNGDLITGENTFLENSTAYLDMIVQPLLTRSLPWASTYGNHDSQYNLSREALLQAEIKYSQSYTQHSPPTVPGVTNYYLLLYPKNSSSKVPPLPLAILWFFDSQGGTPFQASPDSEVVPDFVEPEVVSWFNTTLSELHAQYGPIPSIAFVHIPPTAFLDMQNQKLPKAGSKDGRFPGLNDDAPLAAQGGRGQDLQFVQALRAARGLHSVYSGHDHGDSWCLDWLSSTAIGGGKNIASSQPYLCFCKHSGYGGYGTWNRGARVLRLSFVKDNSADVVMDVETWVRMESGEVVQRVNLNSTYGTDVYPLQDGEN